jgi:hypothetical protein
MLVYGFLIFVISNLGIVGYVFIADRRTIQTQFVSRLKTKMALRKLCWETMFGQELVKLTIMDTLFLLLSVLIGDFFRSTFLRYRHITTHFQAVQSIKLSPSSWM